MPTITLAIEASQRSAGVALRDRAGAAHAESVAPARRHDDDLMPAIDRLVSRCGLQPRDLELIGVSIGPGGFTGIRIAVTTAKMLAQTLGAALVGVPSAIVAANSMTDEEIDRVRGELLVMLAVKNDLLWQTRLVQVNQALPRGEKLAWMPHPEQPAPSPPPPGLIRADAVEYAGLGAVLADSYLPEAIRIACAAREVPVIEPRFDPIACLLAAESFAAAGAVLPGEALLPLYGREPEAVRLFEARREQAEAKKAER